jgi:hypothetical protein
MELLSAFSILAGTGVFRIYYLFSRKERNEKDVSLAMCYNVLKVKFLALFM